MKRIMMLAVCMASLTVLGEKYDASTGYVTRKGGSDNHFLLGDGWSDGLPPHSDTNYYCNGTFVNLGNPSGDHTPFQGKVLVMDSQIQYSAASGRECPFGDTIFLPGSSIFHWSVAPITAGRFTFKSTEAKPMTWTYGRSDWPHYNFPMAADMISDETGWINFRNDRDKTSNFHGPEIVATGDWSEFKGTIHFWPEISFVRSTVFDMPGSFIFDGNTNSQFKLSSTSGGSKIGKLRIGKDTQAVIEAANGTTTFGDLTLDAGAKFALTSSKNTHALSVTNAISVGTSVVLQTGKKIDSAPKATSPEQQPSEMELFAFSAEAVRNGLPTENLEQAIGIGYLTVAKSLTLPRAKFNWADTADGGKTLALSYRRYAQLLSDNANAFKRSKDQSTYWSDGQYPVPGTDYYSQTGTMIKPDDADLTDGVYVFPGDHLAFEYHTGLYAQRTKVNFIAYGRQFSEGNPHPRFRTFFTGQTICLDGTIEVVPNGQYRTCYFQVGDRNTLVIGSSLLGAGDILFYLGMETQTADRTYWKGGAELTGDNRAFTGKMMLAIQEYGLSNFPGGAAAFVPSAVSNVTLTVHGPKNLGGTLPAFTYDALCVSNQNRLVLADTATYDETTRGWFFPETAYLGVKSNAVAKVLNTVTVGGELVKDDTGSVMFAALAQENDADTKKITVRGGSVGALTTTALDGVPLAFAAGAGLIVEAYPSDATFAAKGFTYTDVSKLTSAETIPVTIAGVADWTVDFVPFTVGICTVPTAQAATLAGKMRAKKPAKGIGAKIVTIDNGDGTTTIAANCDKFGLAIVVR